MINPQRIKSYNRRLNILEDSFIISYNKYLLALAKLGRVPVTYINRLKRLQKRIYAIKVRIEYYSTKEVIQK